MRVVLGVDFGPQVLVCMRPQTHPVKQTVQQTDIAQPLEHVLPAIRPRVHIRFATSPFILNIELNFDMLFEVFLHSGYVPACDESGSVSIVLVGRQTSNHVQSYLWRRRASDVIRVCLHGWVV